VILLKLLNFIGSEDSFSNSIGYFCITAQGVCTVEVAVVAADGYMVVGEVGSRVVY
jgi:hypothetical protein